MYQNKQQVLSATMIELSDEALTQVVGGGGYGGDGGDNGGGGQWGCGDNGGGGNCGCGDNGGSWGQGAQGGQGDALPVPVPGLGVLGLLGGLRLPLGL